MKTVFYKFLSRALVAVEMLIAVILLISVLLGLIGLVASMGAFHGDPFRYENFGEFLSRAFTLVIGLEFIRMLVKHSASAVVEVLLFAIARQLVVAHTSTLDTLVGIVAIAGVFAIRKYLFVSGFNPSDLYIFHATKPVSQVNAIARIRLPEKEGQTIGDVMEEHLRTHSRVVEEGAKVTIGTTSMRVATMDNGKIETVDVFVHQLDET